MRDVLDWDPVVTDGGAWCGMGEELAAEHFEGGGGIDEAHAADLDDGEGEEQEEECEEAEEKGAHGGEYSGGVVVDSIWIIGTGRATLTLREGCMVSGGGGGWKGC